MLFMIDFFADHTHTGVTNCRKEPQSTELPQNVTFVEQEGKFYVIDFQALMLFMIDF